MINLLLSLVAGVVVAVVIKLLGFPLLAGILPGTLVFVGLYVVLGRRTFMKLQAVMQQVQAELSSMSPNKKEQQLKADKCIKLLEAALPLGKQQFLLEGEVHGQIGMIKYLFKDYEGAMASFAKTGPRNYFARAMQAAIFFQRKDFGGMEKSFEDAVKHGKKEGLMWAAYAWCLLQNKESDKALKVLARAVEANPSDEKLKTALTAVQNDKRLKMKAWEPMWWQLGLEQPPMPQPQFFQGRRPRFR
ncbi:MAG: tetratricopeptide repeat protein [Myxococcota bacterium]